MAQYPIINGTYADGVKIVVELEVTPPSRTFRHGGAWWALPEAMVAAMNAAGAMMKDAIEITVTPSAIRARLYVPQDVNMAKLEEMCSRTRVAVAEAVAKAHEGTRPKP